MNPSKLTSSKSLYLRQHIENPVDWWPWGQEAFDLALKDKKVIFISIGYSSCHWCHVMSHESFSSEEVADYLNENFICIKVDREEHPDVDQYYQKTAQVMNRQGGWPLSVFLTPDKKPIFLGTYFPLKDRGKVPSFLSVCKEIIKYFAHKQSNIFQQANEIEQKVAFYFKPKEEVPFDGHFPSASSLLKALEPYADKEHGGFGKAPKFPQFAFFEAMIEQTLDGVVAKEFSDHLILTVEKMCFGAMVDQVRGGVHRYSTDEKWLIPHFEKMLYDQAGFLRLLSKTTLLYPSPQLFDLLIMTIDYLRSEMVSEEGYFFSAQDADSEGMEGLYFTFKDDEFEDAVVKFDENLVDDMLNLKKWFNISEGGNFEDQLNVISLNYELRAEIYKDNHWDKIRRVKKALLENRKIRIPPATDNKGIAGWNYMLICALCDVIQYCKIDAIKQSANHLLHQTLPKIEGTFVQLRNEKNLFSIKHCTTQNNTKEYFEDYVFFMEAQWRLYQLTADVNFFKNALHAKNAIIKFFVNNNICYTTRFDTHDLIPNIPYPNFDQSYRSALSTFYLLLIKLRLHEDDINESELENNLKQLLRSWSLYNPLAHGEALRSLIYPIQAFKKLKIPKSWIKDSAFNHLMTYFSHRFIFAFEEQETGWQVCHFGACEAMGETFEQFKTTMTADQMPKQ